MKKIGFFQHCFSKNNMPCENGALIPMQSYVGNKDFYLCIPKNGFYYRSANCGRYGNYCYEYFYNGEFLGGGRMDKKDRIKLLCEKDNISQAIEYIKGYRLWKETECGGNNIIIAKERARISHFLCDDRGKDGHEKRQEIRKILRNYIK